MLKNKRQGGEYMQTITVQIRIYTEHPEILRGHGKAYIDVVNELVRQAEVLGAFLKLTSKDVEADLPSAVRNQAIRDARSVYTKSKNGKRPILKRSVYFVNNQNYLIGEAIIAFPVMIDRKVQRLVISAHITERVQALLSGGKLGILRVVEKSGKWYAQISVQLSEKSSFGDATMGVDLGLKVPAVGVTSTGKTRFVGNGRQNKFMRRKYHSYRKKMGKLKKLAAIRNQQNKEHRYMTDQNHKISREIVNMAIQEKVSMIKVEKLSNIRQTTRTSRKNAKHLHNWSFYQLQMLIAYKAALAGIQVIEVNPAYTSQTCPKCEKRNHAMDRVYRCTCGFHAHRDRVGAINIMHQPVADGSSLPA
jgi:putative transposase